MNLWVKRIGQLMMAVALFFLSCEEETTYLGFKANQRFNVYFEDIPVSSSVYLHDSVVTVNYPGESINRFLVGKYQDDLLGSVTSWTYTQFSRLTTLPDSLDLAVYDSISIQLGFDVGYLYGSEVKSLQEFIVHELDDTLAGFSSFPYHSKNTIPIKPTPLGTGSFEVDPKIFEELAGKTQDTLVRFKLDPEYGKRVFDEVLRVHNDSVHRDSSTTVFYKDFTKVIKGLSIVGGQNDKIVSFNPLSTKSKVVLHLHINKRDSIVLYFSQLASSFNHIEGDRAGTELAGITEPYKTDETTANGYVQNGISILTKLDFSKFLEMADTIPNMMINSAELVIGNVAESPSTQPKPSNLILRILDENNFFERIKSDQDSLDLLKYAFTVGTTTNQTSPYVILNDTRRESQVLAYSSTDKKYVGYPTLFFQELYKNRRSGGPLYYKMALFPTSPSIGKSVNRAVFNKEDIKLRIYYTRPTLEQ